MAVCTIVTQGSVGTRTRRFDPSPRREERHSLISSRKVIPSARFRMHIMLILLPQCLRLVQSAWAKWAFYVCDVRKKAFTVLIRFDETQLTAAMTQLVFYDMRTILERKLNNVAQPSLRAARYVM